MKLYEITENQLNEINIALYKAIELYKIIKALNANVNAFAKRISPGFMEPDLSEIDEWFKSFGDLQTAINTILAGSCEIDITPQYPSGTHSVSPQGPAYTRNPKDD